MDDAQLGARLRQLRRDRRLALADVESMSAREFKASVLGAYERGERQISVSRLAKLAELYGVALESVLSDVGPSDTQLLAQSRATKSDDTREPAIDLTALERAEEEDAVRAGAERSAEGVRDWHRDPGCSVVLQDDEVRALVNALRRALLEIETVLLEIERRGARSMHP
jgi:transcriptional regulator with XRE-family HTH domain